MSFRPSHSKEVREARAGLVARLHASHLILADALDAVCHAGSDDPAQAHLDAARRFESEDPLQRLADTPGLIAQARDIEAFRAFAAAPEPIDNAPDERWWQRQIDEARQRAPKQVAASEPAQARAARHASELLDLPADLLQRSERQWESLLGLPVLIAERGPAEIAAWVAGTLSEIDPAMAAELPGDDPILLTLLDDHDAMLGCMTYLSMMVEAVPSSVYAYLAGPGAVHVPLQLVRLLACAFLGASSAAGRINDFVFRLQSASPGEPEDELLEAAVKELAAHLDQFTTAVIELHTLGHLLAPRTDGRGGLGGALRRIFRR